MREGWICPNCGSAHSPDTETCPGMCGHYTTMISNNRICGFCKKKLVGFSIPKMGIYEDDVCKCPPKFGSSVSDYRNFYNSESYCTLCLSSPCKCSPSANVRSDGQ